ncbi:MAG: aminopeptidase P family protein [Clostridia bacterium]|nr:aminopeptidase P family protein [Clostridia bacterium]
MTVRDMQNLNRSTIQYVASVICPGMFLTEVRSLCESYLLSHGADSFWYWDVGAFVFSGRDTAISISGREYRTPDIALQENDILTIDLSPQRDNIWGDYAHTVVLENGKVVTDVARIQNDEWRCGLQMEQYLHESMQAFVTPETTFEKLHSYANAIIAQNGYINLDFLGNLGHSIVSDKNDRIYIEKGNEAKLSSVAAFTFEPHIARPNSPYGFKMENIYAFESGKLVEL